jgi:hypothetical protein
MKKIKKRLAKDKKKTTGKTPQKVRLMFLKNLVWLQLVI